MKRKPIDLEHRRELPIWLEVVILFASMTLVVSLVGLAMS